MADERRSESASTQRNGDFESITLQRSWPLHDVGGGGAGEGQGRGWAAAKRFSPGDVVIRDSSPVVACAFPAARSRCMRKLACDHCLRVLPAPECSPPQALRGKQGHGCKGNDGQNGQNMQSAEPESDEAVQQTVTCSTCLGAVAYCSSACRASDAALHTLECPRLKRSPGVSTTTRLAARLLWLREVSPEAPEWSDPALCETERQAEGFLREGSGRLSPTDREDLDEECCEVLQYMGREEQTADERVRRDVLILRMWSVAVGSETRGSYGSAWFRWGSLFNHSCRPNCVTSFLPCGGLEVRAVAHVEPLEQLCIAYVDVFQAARFRREDLLNFHFRCSCDRCCGQCSPPAAAPEAPGATVSGQGLPTPSSSLHSAVREVEMEALRCPDASCNGAIKPGGPDWRCPVCCERIPATPQELSALLSEAAELHRSGRELYRSERPGPAAVCFRRCLEIREQLLHRSNVDLLAAREAAARAFIAVQAWEEARSCLEAAVEARRSHAELCGFACGVDPVEVLMMLMDLSRVALEQADEKAKRRRTSAGVEGGAPNEGGAGDGGIRKEQEDELAAVAECAATRALEGLSLLRSPGCEALEEAAELHRELLSRSERGGRSE